MTHKQHRPPFAFRHVLHLADSFLLEFGITYGKYLIYYQYFRFQKSGYGKAQTDGHAAGIAFYGGIYIAFHTGKVDYLVQLVGDFVASHAHDGAVHVDVLTAGQLRMETGTDFQERGNAATGTDGSGGRGGDTRQKFQQGGLPGTVFSDNAYYIALMHIEGDVFQRPDIFRRAFLAAVVGFAYLQIGVFLAENGRFPPAVEVVAQCAGADQTEFVEFAYMVKPDCYIVHSYSLFLILLLTLYP